MSLVLNNRAQKFIAYISIRFDQNLDEKSYISAKIEENSYMQIFFVKYGTAPTSNQTVESHSLF